jgi:hypothetical protein
MYSRFTIPALRERLISTNDLRHRLIHNMAAAENEIFTRQQEIANSRACISMCSEQIEAIEAELATRPEENAVEPTNPNSPQPL